MIELTEQQCQAVRQATGATPRLVDPQTNETDVLLRADVFERVKSLLDEDHDRSVRDSYPLMWEVFGPEGWNDPAMDVYNDPNYPGHS